MAKCPRHISLPPASTPPLLIRIPHTEIGRGTICCTSPGLRLFYGVSFAKLSCQCWIAHFFIYSWRGTAAAAAAASCAPLTGIISRPAAGEHVLGIFSCLCDNGKLRVVRFCLIPFVIQEENLNLRLRLKVGDEAEDAENAEILEIKEKLHDMVSTGVPEGQILQTMDLLTERFADYGR